MFAKEAKDTARTREQKKRVARRWKGVPATDTVEDRSQRRTSTTSDTSPPGLKNRPAVFGLVAASLWAGRRQSLGWSPCGGCPLSTLKSARGLKQTPCTRVRTASKKVQSTVLPCVQARGGVSATFLGCGRQLRWL